MRLLDRTPIPPARYVTGRPYAVEAQWAGPGDGALTGGLELVSISASGAFDQGAAAGRVTLASARLTRTLFFGTLDGPAGRYHDYRTDTPLTPTTDAAAGRVTLQDAALTRVLEFGTLDVPGGHYTTHSADRGLTPHSGAASGRVTLADATLKVTVHFVAYDAGADAAAGRVTLQDATLTQV